MTSLVSHTTVDCRSAYALSQWWKQVLGYEDIEGDPEGNLLCVLRSVPERSALSS